MLTWNIQRKECNTRIVEVKDHVVGIGERDGEGLRFLDEWECLDDHHNFLKHPERIEHVEHVIAKEQQPSRHLPSEFFHQVKQVARHFDERPSGSHQIAKNNATRELGFGSSGIAGSALRYWSIPTRGAFCRKLRLRTMLFRNAESQLGEEEIARCPVLSAGSLPMQTSG